MKNIKKSRLQISDRSERYFKRTINKELYNSYFQLKQENRKLLEKIKNLEQYSINTYEYSLNLYDKYKELQDYLENPFEDFD